MLWVFFESKGLAYVHPHMSMGIKITANYIIKGIGNCMKHCRMKRPVMVMSDQSGFSTGIRLPPTRPLL
jgi:hypothetical protein